MWINEESFPIYQEAGRDESDGDILGWRWRFHYGERLTEYGKMQLNLCPELDPDENDDCEEV